MPKKVPEMPDLEVRRLLNTDALTAVGGVAGLLLQTTASGGASWILRATVAGKRTDIGLGGYPEVTLAKARDKARGARELIRQGIDPTAERREAKQRLIAEQLAQMTFATAADQYITAQAPSWKNQKSEQQWRSSLSMYAFPLIGALPVNAIDTPQMLRVLEPIWATKNETASRIRGRIESILDWATVRKYRRGENPARWTGNLEHLLPAPGKVQKVEHHTALPFEHLHEFLIALRKIEGMGAKALEFAILTACRSGEVRGATWNEINLNKAIWTIPADRMKAAKEHVVPLSSSAIRLLESLEQLPGVDLVFPAVRGGMLSDMTLTAVIRRMNESDGRWTVGGRVITAHGFRSTFRDWAGETTAYPREVIEHAMAHQLKDKAEAAYARGSLFEKRRRLMESWSTHCETVFVSGGTEVVSLRGAA